ncbi:MAG: 16S rRNA (guanine(527)-N(7))-methyltransferase RsmG [Pseudomonadota bacterium]
MNSEIEELTSGVKELGFSILPEQSACLIRYLEQLEITNRSFNLTRIPRNEYVSLHLLDSLTALTALPANPSPRIIDIGTGAGFPGVPLAAMLPRAHVTLLDSTAKKVRFVEETAHNCGILNCVGLHARAEHLASDPKHRGRYDVVVSRAVASFDKLIQLMLPLLKSGGRAIALKGAKAHEELDGTAALVSKLGGTKPVVKTLKLPGSDIERHLIVVDKARP